MILQFIEELRGSLGEKSVSAEHSVGKTKLSCTLNVLYGVNNKPCFLRDYPIENKI